MTPEELPPPPFDDDVDDSSDEFEQFDRRPKVDFDAYLRRVRDLVDGARAMPMSASVMVNREELLDLLDEAIGQLPEELRAARWLLKEREEFIATAGREAEEILDAARAKAEHMVQRTEVVKTAERRARHIIETAEAEARQMRHECEDYCDQRLARFEHILQRTLANVARGRELLAPSVVAASPVEAEPAPDPSGFFDQDRD